MFGYHDLYSFPEPENEDDFEEEENRPSEPQGPGTVELPLAAVEHQLDVLLEEWNKGADMLFSIHPMDGSLLVWHVDWLDEYHPGMFRQAQVLCCYCSLYRTVVHSFCLFHESILPVSFLFIFFSLISEVDTQRNCTVSCTIGLNLISVWIFSIINK